MEFFLGAFVVLVSVLVGFAMGKMSTNELS